MKLSSIFLVAVFALVSCGGSKGKKDKKTTDTNKTEKPGMKVDEKKTDVDKKKVDEKKVDKKEVKTDSYACAKDDDCTFRPPHPCDCPPSAPTLRASVNKAAAKALNDDYKAKNLKCAIRCDHPATNWQGSASKCVNKVCTTVK
ncbi:hypothetical protein KKF34_19680 [Myxococcota bacterium]|nr:hypothetical protein [Myxococcota bacterium]MBU1380245.1 hypothetical protein [Myxococcota bacterium]MBU1499111.1 hypothetical protein [Myxococcota bacterium]